MLVFDRRTQELLDEDSTERQRIVEASELLGQLLLQDVERTEEGVGLKEGVSRDRIVSVHDPEMRHGHKSSSKRFDGHKASVAVDTDSQVITAVDVLPGNASDNVGALELVERSEEGTVSAVEETIGDAAYGDGGTRQAFADAGRTLIAKLPRRPDSKRFPKEAGPFQSWLTTEGHTPPPTWIPACAGMTVCGFRDNGKALVLFYTAPPREPVSV